MNNDLISREALKKAFSNMYREDYERWIKEVIDNAPTIEGTAEWEYTDSRWGLGDWRCSKCGGYSNKDTHYCPNCGARMER